eukprot:TRINITY_DN13645_c0_g1_i8.p1 TRINITY_DN13645_c0_g1~~TRINITY_DN13645_c0_g1_i8.p1  ORF type:complete len:351 (+),score=54.82 TRINITY_DN13645_c0_g1_i8:633-1685(+)
MQLLVEYNHQKFPVKITPMGVLKDVIVQVCAQIKPPVSPGSCDLYHKGEKQDITTPFRFLNIPQGAKMTLISKEGIQLGFGQPDELNKNQNESNTGNVLSQRTSQEIQDQTSNQLLPEGSPQLSLNSLNEILQLRKMVVFVRQDLIQEEQKNQQTDEGDEFFEFTQEDYYVMQSGYAKEHKKQNEWFKTKAQRQIEEEQRASRYSEVLIRVQFPDDFIVQLSFKPLEKLLELQSVITSLIKQEFRKSFYLFTTPPREIIKDYDQTFWSAGLVPAAYVHFRVKEIKDEVSQQNYLSQEVIDLKGDPPQRKSIEVENQQQEQEAKEEIKGPVESQRTSKGGKKLPKWFKGAK